MANPFFFFFLNLKNNTCATGLLAEFGFFGVAKRNLVTTPFNCGLFFNKDALFFFIFLVLGFLKSWFFVDKV